MPVICTMDGCTRAATRTYKTAPEIFHCDQCAGQVPIQSHPIDPTQTTVYTQGYLEQAGVQFVAPDIGFCSSHELDHLAATKHETFDAKWLRNHKTDGAVEPKTWEAWQFLPIRFADLTDFDMRKSRDGKKGSPKNWFAQVKALLDACTEEKVVFFSCQKKQGENGYWKRWETSRDRINPRARFAAMLLARRRNSSYIPENDPNMKQLLSYDRMSWMSFPHLLRDTVHGAEQADAQQAEASKSRTKTSRTKSKSKLKDQAEDQEQVDAQLQVEDQEVEHEAEPKLSEEAEQAS